LPKARQSDRGKERGEGDVNDEDILAEWLQKYEKLTFPEILKFF
jgi:hypothetical protein